MTQHDYTSRLCSNQYTSMTLLIKTSKRMALCMQVSEGVFVYVYLSIDLPAKGAGGQHGGGALQQANAPVPDHLSRQFPLGRRACGILEAILAGITARQWDLGRQLAYRMAKARGLLAGAFIRPSPRPSRAWGSRGSGRCRGGGGLDELGRQMGVGLLGTPWLSPGLSKRPSHLPPPRLPASTAHLSVCPCCKARAIGVPCHMSQCSRASARRPGGARRQVTCA
jgi:hypothetical protein